MATLERAIVQEARMVLHNPKLRIKDLLAWSTGPEEPDGADEVGIHLPIHKINLVVLKIYDKRK